MQLCMRFHKNYLGHYWIFDMNACELLYFSISLACNSYNLQTLTDKLWRVKEF